MQITPRKRRIYWVRKPKGEKDLLIFDGGYVGGDIHVYEFKESYSSKKIEEDMKAEDMPMELIEEIVRLWVEKKYGVPMAWDLKLI